MISSRKVLCTNEIRVQLSVCNFRLWKLCQNMGTSETSCGSHLILSGSLIARSVYNV